MSNITELILDCIKYADGDLESYAVIVKENIEDYRTLDEFISSRIDKQELAERLGLITTRAIDNWATKGDLKFQRAMECAIALKLDLDGANEFLSKYGSMRSLYPATKKDFQYIYVLIHREKLEKQYPYEEKETVKQWVDRVFASFGFSMKKMKKIKEEKVIKSNETRVATKTYLDIIMEQKLELMPDLKFRSVGEKALSFLDERVKDTPFEKNYGNRLAQNDEKGEKNDRNGAVRKDLYMEEEKSHYKLLREKLMDGDIPRRDELIQFAMGMTLGLKLEEVNELLIKSGYEPLMSRNIYEGILIMVYRYLQKSDDVKAEGNKTAKSIDYDDFQVFVSEKIDEAFYNLPEVKHLIREVPKWYLDEKKRKKRMEKRCFSDLIYNISVKMTNTWKMINQNKLEKISEATLRKAANNQLDVLKHDYLDDETYKTVWDIVCRTENKWVEVVNSGTLKDIVNSEMPKDMKRDAYSVIFKETLRELTDFYTYNYAPKMNQNEKKGQSGGKGRKKDDKG